jgi:hypothetical protein
MLFTAKCYLPGISETEIANATARAEQAAAMVSRRGSPVACLGSIAFVDDQLVLWLFEAPSRQAVRRANERAGIPCERVMETQLELRSVPGGTSIQRSKQ